MKGNKGITLIALIITIIILLILAIVTISAVDGYRIIDNAKEAKSSYTNAQEEEKSEITRYKEIINKHTNNSIEQDEKKATEEVDA